MDSLDLIHYPKKPFEIDYKYPYMCGSLDSKPNGLWFSVEDGNGWKEWCIANDFRKHYPWNDLSYKLEIKDNAHILHIKSHHDAISLTRKFPGEVPGSTCWYKIKQHYQGVIFSPYQKFYDKEWWWYENVDCSSGCIWDLDAIHNFYKRYV